MDSFTATLEIIGINPFVSVPDEALKAVMEAAGRDKGPIPIQGTLNGRAYRQTLVKYRGAWRLYVNTEMLPDSPRRIGEEVSLTVAYDPADRTIAPHPKLVAALDGNPEARKEFDALSPSLRKEIVRYIAYLKTEESIARNVDKAIAFLLGKGAFVGRRHP